MVGNIILYMLYQVLIIFVVSARGITVSVFTGYSNHLQLLKSSGKYKSEENN